MLLQFSKVLNKCYTKKGCKYNGSYLTSEQSQIVNSMLPSTQSNTTFNATGMTVPSQLHNSYMTDNPSFESSNPSCSIVISRCCQKRSASIDGNPNQQVANHLLQKNSSTGTSSTDLVVLPNVQDDKPAVPEEKRKSTGRVTPTVEEPMAAITVRESLVVLVYQNTRKMSRSQIKEKALQQCKIQTPPLMKVEVKKTPMEESLTDEDLSLLENPIPPKKLKMSKKKQRTTTIELLDDEAI
ncbi:unnamed protein product [Mytilus coruscus]|uniref:Uncharacterized protein n=1 Tax=Mytilus coruscus TaxID=42192 RepID=A0A6J8BAN3_MYTCO|nr:unnamed protein product [Mytilus coruscus]